MKKIDYATYTKPTDFLRFEAGATTIRIVSNGVLLKKHGMKTAQRYVPLGICTEKADCKFCMEGNEPKQKWTWIAYRKDIQRIGVLDVGPMVGDQICELGRKHGDPQGYDLLITKTGTGRTTKYVVTKGGVTPLTEDEKKFIAPSKAFLVKKYFEQEVK